MTNSIGNPWSRLPLQTPYVLPQDMPFVTEFNRTASTEHAIDVRLLPEPFFGSFDAPVVVLLQNPGLGPSDLIHHQKILFSAALRRSLSARINRTHFHLVDRTCGPGHLWWLKTCNELLADVGASKLSKRLLALEFSPYHSKKFAHAHLRLPSQEFTFELLRAAIGRKSLIICVRGFKEWVGAVPELGTHRHLLRTNSKQAAALSKRNLPKYSSVVAALR